MRGKFTVWQFELSRLLISHSLLINSEYWAISFSLFEPELVLPHFIWQKENLSLAICSKKIWIESCNLLHSNYHLKYQCYGRSLQDGHQNNIWFNCNCVNEASSPHRVWTAILLVLRNFPKHHSHIFYPLQVFTDMVQVFKKKFVKKNLAIFFHTAKCHIQNGHNKLACVSGFLVWVE